MLLPPEYPWSTTYIRDVRAAVQALQCEVIDNAWRRYTNPMDQRRPRRYLPPRIQTVRTQQPIGLETAIVISLFTTSATRTADGDLPGMVGRRCCGPPERSDRVKALACSNREKVEGRVAARAKQYAEESLQWLIETKNSQQGRS